MNPKYRIALLPPVSIRSLNPHVGDPNTELTASSVEALAAKMKMFNSDSAYTENHSDGAESPLDDSKIRNLGERGETFLRRRDHDAMMRRYFEEKNPSTRPDPVLVKEFASQRNRRPQT
jgi:hypothetical protein